MPSEIKWLYILLQKKFIGVIMEINSKIAVQRGGIMVYSGINWLACFVKGGDIKALLIHISMW